MADVVQVAPGNDNPGGLQTFDPQPDMDGITYPRVITTPNGIVYQDGKPFVELRFPDIETPADWVAALAQCGLSTSKSALVTVRLPNPDKTSYANYNGRAVRPEYGSDLTYAYCWYETPRIFVYRLVAL